MRCSGSLALHYFFVDTHGILHASPRPRYGVYAPVYCPSGVAAFGRDGESAQQVWSSRAGYPGDSDYRDFYRDIGFDLDYDYIRPYLHGDGIRVSTGIKYYRITGDTADKAPYDPEAARIKARAHADHFMASRRKQAAYLYDVLGKSRSLPPPMMPSFLATGGLKGRSGSISCCATPPLTRRLYA